MALCKSFLLGFYLWLVVVAYAQDEKLIAEAKKEGKVVVYGSMETNIFDDIQKAFEKKTGVTIEYWRASGATVLDRVISERKTGRPLYDVVINNAGPMEIMLKEGIFTKYESPMTKNFPVETIHPQLGPSYRTSVVGIIYNKTSFSPETAPKTLEDLLKPQFKGKLAFADPLRGAVRQTLQRF